MRDRLVQARAPFDVGMGEARNEVAGNPVAVNPEILDVMALREYCRGAQRI